MKHFTKHPSTITAAKRRVAREGEFDNGHVLHTWYRMTEDEAENAARDQSIKDPDNVYYVANDDVMNPYSEIRWKAGKQIDSNCSASVDCRSLCSKKFTKHPHKVTAAKKRITSSYAMEDKMKRFLEWNQSQADNHTANKQAVEVDYPVMVKYFEANPDVYVDLFHGFLFPEDARYADIFSKMKSLGYKPRSTGYDSRGVFDPAMTIDVPDRDIPEDLEDVLDKYPELAMRRITYHKGAAGSIKLKFILEDTAYTAARDNAHNKGITAAKQPVDSAKNATYKTDRRLSPTSERYRDYLIVLDRNGYGYNIYDKHRELEDHGYPSMKAAKKAVDDIIREENGGIEAAEEADVSDYEDDIREISQEFTSENTSINSGKLPAIFKMVHLEPGTINIDYGGGKFDNVAEYLAPMDVVNLVYDPYNRTPEHNKEVLRTIRKAGGADSATCSNVLNVIKEPEVRRNVLENIRKVVKPEGVVYITVYEGSGKGNEGPTKSGYQLNRKTEGYLAEIQEVFPDAIRKGKLIIAHPSGSEVTGAVSLPSRYWEPGADETTNDLSDEMLLDIYSFLDDYDSEDINTMIRDVMQTYGLSRNLAKMAVWNWRMKDEDIPFTYSDSIEATLSRVGSVSRSELHQRLMDEATGILQRADMHIGAADLSKRLRITEEEIEPDVLRIEVFCPLPQDKLQQLSSELDHIVQEYCPAAYFDYAEPKVAEAYIVDRKINASTRVYAASSVSIKELHDKLLNAASKRLQEPDMGFPLDELADYLIIEEEETEDGALRIEVRYELSYEGMTKLAEALDPIVAKYDKNAYFDMVAPGIMEAFIFNRKITAAKFPELSLDPPEQRELTEYADLEYLTLSLDDDVVVSDGAIDFLATPTFEAGVEEWSLNPDVPDVVVYSEDVAENVLQLIEPEIPLSDGIYHVKGDVTLAYDVLYVFQDDIPVYDAIRPRFNYAESELSEVAVESTD